MDSFQVDASPRLSVVAFLAPKVLNVERYVINDRVNDSFEPRSTIFTLHYARVRRLHTRPTNEFDGLPFANNLLKRLQRNALFEILITAL